MLRTGCLFALLVLALSAGQAGAQVTPAPGAPLPPNYLPGYSPLVPTINTFPSKRPRYAQPIAPQRYQYGDTVYSHPVIVESPTGVITYSAPVVETTIAPATTTGDRVFPVRPLRRLLGR